MQHGRKGDEMTDQELLELAAKAAGIEVYWCELNNCHWLIDDSDSFVPLDNDGDALRLAVKLGLRIEINTQVLGDTLVISEFYDSVECHNGDPYAATRKAIVKAAAEIGKDMEVTK